MLVGGGAVLNYIVLKSIPNIQLHSTHLLMELRKLVLNKYTPSFLELLEKCIYTSVNKFCVIKLHTQHYFNINVWYMFQYSNISLVIVCLYFALPHEHLPLQTVPRDESCCFFQSLYCLHISLHSSCQEKHIMYMCTSQKFGHSFSFKSMRRCVQTFDWCCIHCQSNIVQQPGLKHCTH